MTYVDMIGWVAAALTLATFMMKTMIPLRIVAISSNVSFIAYGAIAGYYPVFALHCLLLPFNTFRVAQTWQLVRKVQQAASGEIAVGWLKPFAVQRHFRAGEFLFRKGDAADELCFLVKGDVRLTEIGKDIEEGQIFGEVAFFLPDRRRTLTARCLSDATVLAIQEGALKQLYYQNPEFGFHLIGLVAGRLTEDIRRVQVEAHRHAGSCPGRRLALRPEGKTAPPLAEPTAAASTRS